MGILRTLKKFKLIGAKGTKYFIYEKLLSLSRRISLHPYSYVKKYAYVLENLPEEELSDKHKNCIWQMWWQGVDENTPEIVKHCLNSVKKHHKEREIIIITKDNYSDFIDIPAYILDKFEKGIISIAHFSDYLRLSLLTKYGGTWLDATVFLTGRISDDILESDFFMFKKHQWICASKDFDEQILEKTRNTGGIASIWFIHCRNNNSTPIIKTQKAILQEYWKHERFAIDYPFFHSVLTLAVIKNKACRESFFKSISLSDNEPHFLQFFMADKFDEKLFNEIISTTTVHKLTYKKTDIKRENSFLGEIFNRT